MNPACPRATSRLLVAAVFLAGSLLGACQPAAGGTPTTAPGTGERTTLHLGYFPNVTHAPAIIAVEKGFFAGSLGPNVGLETSTFNAGPAASEALLSGAIDAAFIGPNPAINAFAKSKGAAIRIVAGSTSGGAFLVVRGGINRAADLKGKTLASPQLGNTQDVALRTWLASQGFSTTPEGGGDVAITPQDNAQTLETFKSGQIDGAWVPEPWASRLILEGGGHVLVDERDLWPGGAFATTHLIVRTDFLKAHPDAVRGLIAGELAAVDFANAQPAEAQAITNAGIEAITGKKLTVETLAAAWKNLTFTVDPIASSLKGSADHAQALGLLDPVNLTGIYDLTLLNEVLVANGRQEVTGR